MKKLQAKLKVAKAELKIRRKTYNAAARALLKTIRQIDKLEADLERQQTAER